MVVNFRVCEINRGARKLTRTPMLIIIKKLNESLSIKKTKRNQFFFFLIDCEEKQWKL